MARSSPNKNRQFLAILKVELLQLVRDKRALFAAIALPMILYPWLFAGQQKIEKISEETLSSRTVHAVHDLTRLPQEWIEPVMESLQSELVQPIEWSTVDARSVVQMEEGVHSPEERELLRREAFELLLDDPQELLVVAHGTGKDKLRPEIALYYDVKEDSSREAQDRVSEALRGLERQKTAELREELLGGDPAAYLDIEVVDVASAAKRSGAKLGRLLPMLLVLLLMSGGAFAALTVFAGEREAGTLESILVQPVPPQVLTLGKFGAVAVAAFATLLANLGALYFCVAMGWTGDGGGGADVGGLDPVTLLGALCYLPGALLLCALLCLALGKARTFREGQYLLFPITLVAALPSAIVLQPSLPNTGLISAIPFTGAAMVLRDVLRGDPNLLHIAVMTVSHLAWTYLLLLKLSTQMDGERALSASSDVQRLAKMGPARHGMRWGFAGVLVIYLIGFWMQSKDPIWGLAYTLWGLLPPMAILCALRIKRRLPTVSKGEPFSLARELGLRPPPVLAFVGALLLVPALSMLMEQLLTLQTKWLPMPSMLGDSSGLEQLFGGLTTPQLLFLIAITPGICEELFFRGAVLSSMRRGMGPVKAVFWQALFFAAAHASIYRLMPTFTIGILLGAITLRARSIWPAVILHATYNGYMVLRGAQELEGHWEVGTWHPAMAWLALLGAFFLLPNEKSVHAPFPKSASGPE